MNLAGQHQSSSGRLNTRYRNNITNSGHLEIRSP